MCARADMRLGQEEDAYRLPTKGNEDNWTLDRLHPDNDGEGSRIIFENFD
jgi:hypothetical protein